MAIPVFSPPCGPSWTNTSVQTEARVLTAQLGDGYQQYTADGINTQRDTWTLQWDGAPEADMQAIYGFCASMGGWMVFEWTAPGDSAPKAWRCAKWGRSPTGPTTWTITATFVQQFDTIALV